MSEIDIIQKSNLQISWSCDDHVPPSDVLIKLVSKHELLENTDICTPLTASQMSIANEVIDGIHTHLKKLHLPSFHFSVNRIHVLPNDEFNKFSAIIISADPNNILGFQRSQRIYLRAEMEDCMFASILIHELVHASAYQHIYLQFNGYDANLLALRLGITGEFFGPLRRCMWLIDEMVTEVLSIQIRQILKLSALSATDQDIFSKFVAYPDVVMLYYDTMIKAHQKDGFDQKLWRILLQDYFLGTLDAPRALYHFDPTFFKKLKSICVDAGIS
ncbi:hypothetical protein IT409_02675 [Candidatus Falkowbacteria bacterium]|nr:hypothetical protein [Candidatus Falkowbacteria bacterium]